MEYQIDILDSAKKEIRIADDYYAEISKSISDRFLKELKLTLSYLELNPYFPKRYNDLWTIPLKKFPYLLFYTIDEKKKLVKIISCFHTSQNPTKYPE